MPERRRQRDAPYCPGMAAKRTLSALHLSDADRSPLGVVWITPHGWLYQCSVCSEHGSRGTADLCLAALSIHLELAHAVEAERF